MLTYNGQTYRSKRQLHVNLIAQSLIDCCYAQFMLFYNKTDNIHSCVEKAKALKSKRENSTKIKMAYKRRKSNKQIAIAQTTFKTISSKTFGAVVNLKLSAIHWSCLSNR